MSSLLLSNVTGPIVLQGSLTAEISRNIRVLPPCSFLGALPSFPVMGPHFVIAPFREVNVRSNVWEIIAPFIEALALATKKCPSTINLIATSYKHKLGKQPIPKAQATSLRFKPRQCKPRQNSQKTPIS